MARPPDDGGREGRGVPEPERGPLGPRTPFGVCPRSREFSPMPVLPDALTFLTVTHPSAPAHAARLVVISRFRIGPQGRAGFLQQMDAAIMTLAQQSGCLAASLGQSTDEAELVLLRTEWAGVGAYRKALSAYEVKVSVVPLLSQAVDESSAFETIREWDGHRVVESISGLAADAGGVRLGSASAPSVPPVES